VKPKTWIDRSVWREINDILTINGFAWLENGKESEWINMKQQGSSNTTEEGLSENTYETMAFLSLYLDDRCMTTLYDRIVLPLKMVLLKYKWDDVS
jgi:hypothetical protein